MSDVSDDVRRAAVTSLGFLLFRYVSYACMKVNRPTGPFSNSSSLFDGHVRLNPQWNLRPFTARVNNGDLKGGLTFESVDEILWCYHSNETSSAVLSHGTFYLVCSSNF